MVVFRDGAERTGQVLPYTLGDSPDPEDLWRYLANYQDTALTAFREVESALVGEELLKEQLAAVLASAEESVGAQELAEERYERGLVDIITVLESQRRAFTARSNMLSVKNQLLQNRLSLYLALGGDF